MKGIPYVIYNWSILLSVSLSSFACSQEGNKDSFLIQNVQVVDGSGVPAFISDVRVEAGKIHKIGKLKVRRGEEVISGEGLSLAPGFIDTHSHHDMDSLPSFEAALSQGITTIVIGQDGRSHFPLAAYFSSCEKGSPALNIASYIGHNTLRQKVMGEDYRRVASPAEVEEMQAILQEEMKSGALGLSTGLEYDPGIYASEAEVLSLAKTLKPYGGRYISHMRSEDVALEQALEELITIGREAQVPVQVSHMKLGRKSLWGKAQMFIDRMDRAREEGVDITADVYPYEYWQSTMTVLFPKRDFDNRESALFAITELTSPEGMILAQFNAMPGYEGKTLADISAQRGESPEITYMKLIEMGQAVPGESIIAKSMVKEDFLQLLSWPHANLCSDGAPRGHPRGWGAFPRYFHMARDLPIEDRIHKMTAAAAKHMGFLNRGVLKEEAYADMVLFDAQTLKDNATFAHSQLPSSGIHTVWVNGIQVFANRQLTGKKGGKILRRATYLEPN